MTMMTDKGTVFTPETTEQVVEAVHWAVNAGEPLEIVGRRVGSEAERVGQHDQQACRPAAGSTHQRTPPAVRPKDSSL